MNKWKMVNKKLKMRWVQVTLAGDPGGTWKRDAAGRKRWKWIKA
jgi:hypothetical protein